jgi:hypothetical protein
MKTPRHRQYTFRLQIGREQFLQHYQGIAASVQVVSECGKRLRFPAARLRPLLTHGGISGRFRLTIDNSNRFVNLERINSL